MAIHLEFVVLGPPISNQQSSPRGRANLTTWRAAVAGVAQGQWTRPILLGELKAIIINFYSGPHALPGSGQHVQANPGRSARHCL